MLSLLYLMNIEVSTWPCLSCKCGVFNVQDWHFKQRYDSKSKLFELMEVKPYHVPINTRQRHAKTIVINASISYVIKCCSSWFNMKHLTNALHLCHFSIQFAGFKMGHLWFFVWNTVLLCTSGLME